jgi:hypothetical protein
VAQLPKVIDRVGCVSSSTPYSENKESTPAIPNAHQSSDHIVHLITIDTTGQICDSGKVICGVTLIAHTR